MGCKKRQHRGLETIIIAMPIIKQLIESLEIGVKFKATPRAVIVQA